MFTLGEIIDLAVRIEKNGEMSYRKAQKEVSDASLADLLGRLADEEAEHEKWFLRFKEKVTPDQEDPRLEEMGKAVMQGVLGEQAFSVSEADFSRIEDRDSLLTLSVEFEKDTVLFYEMLGAFIEDEKTLEKLDQIIQEENRHIRLLNESLKNKTPLPSFKGPA
ncbi:MAG: ferritin family protein [Deltaproteobacteria bacterium]|nr:ferritin family protein [Deltaproteobacteria bacterium]